MALRAGYKGIKKYVADMLNKMNPGDTFATDAEIATKADISALGTQEGATASKLYHPGEYFYKDGQSCEVIGSADVAQGTTWALNTNYKVKSVYDALQSIGSGIKIATVTENTSAYGWIIVKDENNNIIKPSEYVLLSIYGQNPMTATPPYNSAFNVTEDTTNDQFVCKLVNAQTNNAVADGIYSITYTVAYVAKPAVYSTKKRRNDNDKKIRM